GDVSCIKRGGYNLHEALGWPSSDYEETHTFVVQLAHEHLNINKSWSSQAKAGLTVIYAEAKKRYHILDRYEGNWVVSDMLRIFLKKSCSH
ncbi:uncharacterized protein EDB91DRAFT_1062881, partial [Suillus paluster]|uniref:uncharacterized protein n=1 Tax=Suillus paluster TaxID=48578 RepID=UPI001B87630B